MTKKKDEVVEEMKKLEEEEIESGEEEREPKEPPWIVGDDVEIVIEEEEPEIVAEAVADSPVKVVLEPLELQTPGGDEPARLALLVKEMTVTIGHGFGESPRYKTRNAEGEMVIQAWDLIQPVTLGEGATLSDLVKAVVDACVVGVEVAVGLADERSGEEQEKLNRMIEQARMEGAANARTEVLTGLRDVQPVESQAL